MGRLVMKKLGYQIPKWQLTRKLRITSEGKNVKFQGIDTNGAPYDYIEKLTVTGLQKSALSFPSSVQKSQPFKAEAGKEFNGKTVNVKVDFYKKRGEPSLTMKVDLEDVLKNG